MFLKDAKGKVEYITIKINIDGMDNPLFVIFEEIDNDIPIELTERTPCINGDTEVNLKFYTKTNPEKLELNIK